MDKKTLQQVRIMQRIQQNILDKSTVKNQAFATELARKWVKRI